MAFEELLIALGMITLLITCFFIVWSIILPWINRTEIKELEEEIEKLKKQKVRK